MIFSLPLELSIRDLVIRQLLDKFCVRLKTRGEQTFRERTKAAQGLAMAEESTARCDCVCVCVENQLSTRLLDT